MLALYLYLLTVLHLGNSLSFVNNYNFSTVKISGLFTPAQASLEYALMVILSLVDDILIRADIMLLGVIAFCAYSAKDATLAVLSLILAYVFLSFPARPIYALIKYCPGFKPVTSFTDFSDVPY